MSGLLHRLAQRTLNVTPPRVRSVAPIPWLATPGSFEAVEPATPAPVSAVPQTRTARPVAPLPEVPVAALHNPLDAPLPEPPVVSASAMTATDHVEALPAPTFGGEPREPRAGAPTAPATLPNPPPAMASPEAPTATAAPRMRPVRARLLPAPLIAPPPDASAESAGARSGPYVAVAAADREPATEVHVHIGRVELTAVAESPTPQRKSRSARTGRSLDEYLQQRKERYR